MLTGSVAMNYYAVPRMTRDIDIVVALTPGDAQRLRAQFEADYYLPPPQELARVLETRGMFNLVHLASLVKVDVVVRKDEPYRAAEFARRRQIELPGFRVWIVSKEDLILSKLLWARDSQSELQRRDVQNLLATGVDEAYLGAWAKQLGVVELLETLRHA
jgi:hypothetical protein